MNTPPKRMKFCLDSGEKSLEVNSQNQVQSFCSAFHTLGLFNVFCGAPCYFTCVPVEQIVFTYLAYHIILLVFWWSKLSLHTWSPPHYFTCVSSWSKLSLHTWPTTFEEADYNSLGGGEEQRPSKCVSFSSFLFGLKLGVYMGPSSLSPNRTWRLLEEKGQHEGGGLGRSKKLQWKQQARNFLTTFTVPIDRSSHLVIGLVRPGNHRLDHHSH